MPSDTAAWRNGETRRAAEVAAIFRLYQIGTCS